MAHLEGVHLVEVEGTTMTIAEVIRIKETQELNQKPPGECLKLHPPNSNSQLAIQPSPLNLSKKELNQPAKTRLRDGIDLI